MQKKWNEYQIIDTRQLVNELPEDEREQYNHKVLFKNNALTDSVMMFSKSDFKKYRENNDAFIVGQIRKRQKHYKVYEQSPKGSLLSYPPQNLTVEELINKKQQKNIIGSATMEFPEFAEKVTDKKKCKLSDTDKPKYSKMYDVKENGNNHTIGYAYVGDNKFLQVTTFNLLWLLLPLLIAIIIVIVLQNCPNGNNPEINYSLNPNWETAKDDYIYFGSMCSPNKLILAQMYCKNNDPKSVAYEDYANVYDYR